MGLDMYFMAVKRNYTDGEQAVYPKKLKAFEDYIAGCNFKSKTLIEQYQIGYFRKFNALHGRIVEDYGGGEDEGQSIYLDKAAVARLLAACKAISEDHDKAELILPAKEGFFFGSCEYDDWYFQDLEEAIKLFELILKEFDFEEYDLVYQASW